LKTVDDLLAKEYSNVKMPALMKSCFLPTEYDNTEKDWVELDELFEFLFKEKRFDVQTSDKEV
jgi:hypothetical protein